MVHKSIHKSAIVAYSCREMYDLVSDIDQYHCFLSYCQESHIVEVQDNTVTGRLVFAYMGLSFVLETQNINTPYRCIEMTLDRGDVRTLSGKWCFEDQGDGYCKVLLDLEVELSENYLHALFNRMVDRLADRMVSEFVDRACTVYGLGDS